MRFFAGTFTESNNIGMKKIFLYFILSLSALVISPDAICQDGFTGKRTFYIVRHAEKDTAGGNNPAISVVGKERAGDLYRELRKKKIDLIMATQYKRTGMTADSLRIYNNIDSIQYGADATGNKLSEVLNLRSGNAKHILIVGHSNTLPAIIRKLGVISYTVKELPETEYDNLFIVRVKNGKATLEQKKFGKSSK